MIWFLKGKDNSCCYFPLIGKDYRIGRSSKSILKLDHEKSGYYHARIVIAKKTKPKTETFLDYKNEPELSCSIIDCSSSAGTFLFQNGSFERLDSEKPYELAAGANLIFGKDPFLYEVNFENPVVFVSEKYVDTKDVKADLEKLGVKVYDKLNNQCTHYVHLIKIPTQTYAAALAQKIWITGPGFWTDCVKAFKNGSTWPNVLKYQLKLEASQPNSYIHETIPINYSLDRSNLFKGLTFIFFSTSDIDNHGRVVRSAGGIPELYCKLWFENKKLGPEVLLVKSHAKDLKPNNGSVIEEDDYNLIKSMISEMGRRMIRRSEIVAAVFKNSTAIYCNQFITMAPKLDRKRPANSEIPDFPEADIILIEDDDDDDVVKSTPQKPLKIKTEKDKISTLKGENFPAKKPKLYENEPENKKWLSAKIEKDSSLTTRSISTEEFAVPKESPRKKTLNLRELVSLAQKIEEQDKAIKKLEAKFKFNPFKSIKESPDSSSSPRKFF